jgi:DNA repair protein RecO (recombination protein O)
VPAVLDDALCIRHWDWSETSQTVSLLTRSHGVIRGLAKGSRRENARFSGGVELLTRGSVQFIAKPTTELATLTEWDLTEIFPDLRASLPRFYAAMYLADLLAHAIRDHDPHPRAFDAALACLRHLGTPTARTPVDEALARVQWTLLGEMGVRPTLRRDARTGAPIADRAVHDFAPGLGGFLAAPDPAVTTWRVKAATIARLQQAEADDRATPDLDPDQYPVEDDDTWTRASRFAAAYFREVLGQSLASLDRVYPRATPPTSPRQT